MLSAGDVIGHYRLIRKLGGGGFGEVWLVQHIGGLDVQRAMKVPTNDDYIRQLRKEANIQFKLEHPNIVRTIDLNVLHEPPYFVMEYVEGQDLRKVLEARGKLPPVEALGILCQILEGLRAAHAQGVTHRDLKPENILVAANGIVKVTDFGLGRVQAEVKRSLDFVEDSLRSKEGQATAGTFVYMSPEQQSRKPADPRDDIYAVGLIGCELLMGSRPAASGVAKALKRGGIHDSVTEVLEKACDEALFRYPSASPMLDDVRALLANKPTTLRVIHDQEEQEAAETRERERQKLREQKAGNLRAAVSAGTLDRFVDEHRGSWTEGDWLHLLETLESHGHWPVDEARLREALEGARGTWQAKQGAERRQAEEESQRREEEARQAETERRRRKEEELRRREEEAHRAEEERLRAEEERRRRQEEARRRAEATKRELETTGQGPARRHTGAKVMLVVLLVGVGLVLFLTARAPRKQAAEPPEKHVQKVGPLPIASASPAERARIREALRRGDQEFTNSIGMRLRRIEAGSFMMGSETGKTDEKPVHRVTLSKPFYLSVLEVTQEQYERVTGTNPSQLRDTKLPVERVSWHDAKAFCQRLSEVEGVTYRLPTEAEWEHACRAGSTSVYSFGVAAEDLGDHAWFDLNSSSQSHPVGEKRANTWGLRDMHGNVCEWCEDWYAPYPTSEQKDPTGGANGITRVFRGGSWLSDPRALRSANRDAAPPEGRYADLGFRVVLAPGP